MPENSDISVARPREFDREFDRRTDRDPQRARPGDGFGPARLSGSSQPEVFDLSAVISALWSRKWTVIGITAAAAIAAVLIALQMQPQYTAIARLSLDSQQPQVVDVQSVTPDRAVDDAIIGSEVGVLYSNALLERVVRGLGLHQDPEFVEMVAEGGMSPDQVVDVAVTALRQSLDIAQSGNSLIIDIAAHAQRPREAALIANAVANVYVLEQLERRTAEGERANAWLAQRLDELRTQLGEAEDRVQAYQSESLRETGEGRVALEARLEAVSRELAAAQAAAAQAKARVDRVTAAIAEGKAIDTLPEVVASELIWRMREQLVALQTREANMLTHRGSENPEIRSLRSEIATQQQALVVESNRVAESLRDSYQSALEYEQSLAGVLRGLQDRLLAQEARDSGLGRLQGDVETLRTVYENFLIRYRETSETADILVPESRIVSEARPPLFPSGVSRKVVVILATVFGLTLGCLVALLQASLNRRISGAARLERVTQAPNLGTIPPLPKDWRPGSATPGLGDSARRIANVLRLRCRPPLVLGVTTPRAGTGASAAALLLAGELAASYRVLVVGEAGAASHDFRVVDVAQEPARWTPAMLGARRNEMTRDFDYVLVILPPLLDSADALNLGMLLDGVLLVARENITEIPELDDSRRLLEDANIPLVGTILSDVAPAHGAAKTRVSTKKVQA